jgi:hypothetical protein
MMKQTLHIRVGSQWDLRLTTHGTWIGSKSPIQEKKKVNAMTLARWKKRKGAAHLPPPTPQVAFGCFSQKVASHGGF